EHPAVGRPPTRPRRGSPPRDRPPNDRRTSPPSRRPRIPCSGCPSRNAPPAQGHDEQPTTRQALAGPAPERVGAAPPGAGAGRGRDSATAPLAAARLRAARLADVRDADVGGAPPRASRGGAGTRTSRARRLRGGALARGPRPFHGRRALDALARVRSVRSSLPPEARPAAARARALRPSPRGALAREHPARLGRGATERCPRAVGAHDLGRAHRRRAPRTASRRTARRYPP